MKNPKKYYPERRRNVKISPQAHAKLLEFCKQTGLKIEFFASAALEAAVDAARTPSGRGHKHTATTL
jgi:hypothetical protein